MRILEPLVRRPTEQRVGSLEEWFTFQSLQYQAGILKGSKPADVDATFLSYVEQIHRRNGVVAAAVVTRALLLSQLRFNWRRERSQGARAGQIWTDDRLAPLERPGSTTRANLLFQLEQDASYAGTGYVIRDGDKLRRLRPDRCSFVLGSNNDPEWDSDDIPVVPADVEVMALMYSPDPNGNKRELFFPGEFATWCPEPDSVHPWRGQSWVTSVMREILTDGQATDHTTKFFENAATPNLVFMMDPTKSSEEVKEYAKVVNDHHAGAGNAYKNMYLGGGTDVKVVGSTLETLNLKDLQGGLETRIALRARIPGVILGIREGYAGSSLNAGNYSSARRMLADGWLAPTAQGLCAALEPVVRRPGGSELWYDDSDILFLQEDQKDAAEILNIQGALMRQLIDAGYEPATVTEAVTTGDLTKLVHTGNVSVQLQPAGSDLSGTD